MSFVIRKVKNQPFYSVKNRETGEVYSHHATKASAKNKYRYYMIKLVVFLIKIYSLL